MMRVLLSALISVFHAAACFLCAAEIPEPFLPPGVAFGMTRDAVRAARPGVFEPEVPVAPYRVARFRLAKDKGRAVTNSVSLMESAVDQNPVVMRIY
jgi:hypothetical protein